MQAKSSYLPNEVLWGYRFVNLLNFKHSASEYKIDYSAFNAVYKVNMDSRSQKERDEEQEEEDEEGGVHDQTNSSPLTHSISCIPGELSFSDGLPMVSRALGGVFL